MANPAFLELLSGISSGVTGRGGGVSSLADLKFAAQQEEEERKRRQREQGLEAIRGFEQREIAGEKLRQSDPGALLNLDFENMQTTRGGQFTPLTQAPSPETRAIADVVDDTPFLARARQEGLTQSQVPEVQDFMKSRQAEELAKRSPEITEGRQDFGSRLGQLLLETGQTQEGIGELRDVSKRDADWESKQIEMKAKEKEEAQKLSDAAFKDETTLRKEFDNLSKTFRATRDSYNRILASADNPSAAGDLALIFNYMKVLDPGSVVRESEFANAAASGAFGDRLQAAALKILKGERLSDAMRSDFVNRADLLYGKAIETQQNNIDRFKSIGQRRGLNVENIIQDINIKRRDTGDTTNTTTFILNGEEYNIPASEVGEFLRDNPNAQRR